MKSIKSVMGILATLLLLSNAHAQTFLTNGLVAYYPFNGNANDASGNGNNGTVHGATLTTNRFGVPNHAYSFNGTNSLIQIPETIFGPAVQAVTISAWITFGSGPYNNVQVILEKSSVNGEIAVGAHPSASSPVISFAPDLASSSWIETDAPLQSNRVVHVVSVYQQGQSVSVYTNGILSSATNVPNQNLLVSPDEVVSAIGAYDSAPAPYEFFRGTIDEVRIYTNALTASEVQQLYQIESVAPCIPHGAEATAQVTNGFVIGANITDTGCGYTNTPLVLIEGGGGTGATATAVVSNGVVVNIIITDAGVDYTSTPNIYIYSPFGLQIGLIQAFKPSFTGLLIGTNYQLQISTDLTNWVNEGSVFTATNPIGTFPQYFDVTNSQRLFFRLQVQ